MGNARKVDKEGNTKCSSCRRWLPSTREFFRVSKTCAGGIAAKCRACSAKYHRRWKRKNRARLLDKRREDYASNPRIKRVERVRKSRDPYITRARAWRQGMRERSAEFGVPFDAEYFTSELLADLLRKQEACLCCGVLFSIEIGRGRVSNTTPSIDRIRPERGYTIGNVALICWRCNNLKRDATPDELSTVAAWMWSVWGNEYPNEATEAA